MDASKHYSKQVSAKIRRQRRIKFNVFRDQNTKTLYLQADPNCNLNPKFKAIWDVLCSSRSLFISVTKTPNRPRIQLPKDSTSIAIKFNFRPQQPPNSIRFSFTSQELHPLYIISKPPKLCPTPICPQNTTSAKPQFHPIFIYSRRRLLPFLVFTDDAIFFLLS